MTFPIPPDEAARLEELRAYDVLDTAPEDAFDRITHLAARVFSVPIVLVSLIDAERQWFKSCYGTDLRETDRDVSFCAHAILTDGVMVVEDATEDARFADNPLVTGAPHIRFYAGAPLRAPSGRALGTLCLLGAEPRALGAERRAMLADMAALVVDELELRREIAQRKQAEDALRASEERFRKLVQHAADITTVLAADGTVLYESPSVEKVLGFSPEALEGQNAFDFVHPDDRAALHPEFERILRRPSDVTTVQFRMQHADGSWVHLEAVANNLLSDPAVQGLVVHSRDVSHSVRYESERQARQRAEELLEARTTLVNNVSHELRTPLSAILGFADVLAEEVEEPHTEFVKLIQNSGKRLRRTIDALLNFAQLETGQASTNTDVLDVLDVAAETREATALLQPVAQEEGLTLSVEAETEAHARADSDSLHGILNNLIGNAIKFTPSGRITVRVTPSDEHVTVEIADTGVGIDAAFLPHLFESFRQESNGLARTHDGNGLGLTITQRLVQQMGGAIAVDSEKGAGTTFTVTFPAAAPDASPVAGQGTAA